MNGINALPFPTTDARKWAAEFVCLHGGDEDLMLSWFANAIEHGRGPDPTRETDRSEAVAALEWALDYIEELDQKRRPPLGQPFLNERLIRYREIAARVAATLRPEREEAGLRTDVDWGRPGGDWTIVSPTFAEMLLTAHYQHIAPCSGEPCSCHYFEDLAVIRAALAAPVAGLDVEILSRAIRGATFGTRAHVSVDEARVLAKSVAHEYAVRLPEAEAGT